MIVLSRFLGKCKIFKDLIHTVGLLITSFTVSGDIKKKNMKILKKSSENDQLTGHLQSFFIFFFIPPTLNLKFFSRKSTNKKILALAQILI